jgi:6-phosphogluconolactonase
MALLTIVNDEQTLAERVADRFVAVAHDAVRQRGSAMVCLTGGTTPKRAYELLATQPWQQRVSWDHLQIYWTDERHVPPDHTDSNYGMARDALVMNVPIPASHVHRIRGELDPEEAARAYERELAARFDLLLLGVGEDAHIASIFPGSPLIHERNRRVAAAWVTRLKAYRITLTPPALLASEHIGVIVAGGSKASAVAVAFHEPADVERYPVHLLRSAGDRVEWFIDRAAGRDVASRPG